MLRRHGKSTRRASSGLEDLGRQQGVQDGAHGRLQCRISNQSRLSHRHCGAAERPLQDVLLYHHHLRRI